MAPTHPPPVNSAFLSTKESFVPLIQARTLYIKLQSYGTLPLTGPGVSYTHKLHQLESFPRVRKRVKAIVQVRLKEIRGYICTWRKPSFIHVCVVHLFPSFCFQYSSLNLKCVSCKWQMVGLYVFFFVFFLPTLPISVYCCVQAIYF